MQATAFSGPLTQRKLINFQPQKTFPFSKTLCASVKYGRVGNINDDPKTDLNRIKFMHNELKDNVLESKLRATAAENRTRLLKKKLDDYEAQVDEESDRISSEKIKALKAKQKKESTEWDNKYCDLKNELDKATQDCDKSQADLLDSQTELKMVEKKMSDELENLRLKLKSEYDAMELQYDKLRSSEQKYESELSSFRAELGDSKKAVQAANVKIQSLEDERSSMQKRALENINALSSFRAKLGDSKDEVQAANMKIQSLEDERSSVRKLARIQVSLLKEKVKRRYQAIRGKN